MVLRTSIFILAGYLSGSVLYASVFAKLFKIENFTEMSPDHNPGIANAFRYGCLLGLRPIWQPLALLAAFLSSFRWRSESHPIIAVL